ncbi:MAG: glycoside hydrolase family 78 protein [Sedimentisphaerales bacterium]|nr:glycoside hydrolase family 78 protein [Sedimentisphaerales bacterium]
MNDILKTITLVIIGLALTGCAVLKDGGDMSGAVTVEELRCEYRVNPLGIDVTQPRLSWIMQSGERGQVQTACQILVTDKESLLDLNVGNLWDSGKIVSDRSNQVEYKGKPLKSSMQCYWKVRVWDKDGNVSEWSKPAFWTMGLLNIADWQGKWIGYETEPLANIDKEKAKLIRLDDCKWVWFGEGDPRKSGQIRRRFFRRKIEISPDKTIKRARFRLTANNEVILFLNGQEIHRIPGLKPSQTLDITGKLTAGDNTLAIESTNEDDAANHAVLAGKLLIEFEAGQESILIDGSWKASQTRQDNWQKQDFDDAGWHNAEEIAKVGDEPWGKPSEDELILPPPSYLRKGFLVDRTVKRAAVYVSALGLYELYINGYRVGDDFFTPGWTDYPTRVYYQSYDVTKLLKRGSNAIGAILADGWYAGYVGFGRKRENYGSQPRLLVQLEVEYADGGRKVISTDKSWKAAYGPLVEADFLMGETYDSRKEMLGWDTSQFDDSTWNAVTVAGKIDSKVEAHPGVTVKKIMEIKPVKRTQPKDGAYVFDMGQNFAGWARLKAKGKAGTKVVLRFAEMLKPDGTIYTENLRAARCTDTYILNGKGQEVWEPRFTFHGFRYVEVTGYPGEPRLDNITGIVVHSDTPQVGSFECSNPMVNQLYNNIVWSQRSNFIEVPTDCPQRDERLGWTGDAQIFIRTATYNMNVAAFFTKWLVDLEDSQSKEGAFPDVAPRKIAMGEGTAAWGDAGVICPWTIYQVYGDKRVIEQHYESMKRWIAYLKENSNGLLRPDKGYGDWVAIGEETPKDVIATAYFAYSARLLSKMAAAIGKDHDAKEYELLFKQIKDAFNKAYVSDDGKIKGDTQTCYCLGLYFDLLPESKRELAAKHLVEAIKRRDWHLSTGFVGLSYLLPTLTQTGHLDIAYRLLNNDTFPSWGYSIKNGATTIWERWDGWTEEKGFQNPGMNSFNHYSFGSVGQWLFGTVAGIETDELCYKKIIIRPRPGGGITAARASYVSINGQIESFWKIEGNKFMLNVTIPVNTTATVYVLAKDTGSVTESGRPANQSNHVQFLRTEDGCAVFAVRSGNYRFVSSFEMPKVGSD